MLRVIRETDVSVQSSDVCNGYMGSIVICCIKVIPYPILNLDGLILLVHYCVPARHVVIAIEW